MKDNVWKVDLLYIMSVFSFMVAWPLINKNNVFIFLGIITLFYLIIRVTE